MIHAVASRIAEAWLACGLIQLALWLVAQRTRNAGIVDVGWALSFSVVIGVFAVTADAPLPLPLIVIVIAWSARLGGYLIQRGAASGPEEGRYADLRARWGDHASRNFFMFFQAQAALTAILSTAFVIPFAIAPSGCVTRVAGIAISAIGILGETIADAQLARFRRDPANRGQVCDRGLWSVSRHPNYFFEWCVWIGYAVYGLAFAWPWCLVALGAQALIVASIVGVTGIPPTEKQAIRSKGDAYRAYQARVSRFIPLPPKRSQPTSD